MSKIELLLATCKFALRGDWQGPTFPPLQIATIDTTYCNVVLIASHKTSQFTLCDTGSGNVQKSAVYISSLGNVAGNVDEVEISTVSTPQCPAHNDIHSSTDISREVNTGEARDSGGVTCVKNGRQNRILISFKHFQEA